MLELQHHHIMCMAACPHTMLHMMVSTALSLSFRKNQQSSHYTISLLTPPKCIMMCKYHSLFPFVNVHVVWNKLAGGI